MDDFLFGVLITSIIWAIQYYCFELPTRDEQSYEYSLEKGKLRRENKNLMLRIHELELENMRLKTKVEIFKHFEN